MGNAEAWPRASLSPRQRGRASKCRHLSPTERAEIEADLRERGDLDPEPDVKAEEGSK